MFLSNNDIYFVGIDSSNKVYWKNGIKTILPFQSPYSSVFVNSIFVQNNNVYVAGSQYYYNPQNGMDYNNATYWNNTSINKLTSSLDEWADLYDIFVKNNIIYTVGSSEDRSTGNLLPLYFQNNIPVPLGGVNNAQEVYLTSIFVQ